MGSCCARKMVQGESGVMLDSALIVEVHLSESGVNDAKARPALKKCILLHQANERRIQSTSQRSGRIVHRLSLAELGGVTAIGEDAEYIAPFNVSLTEGLPIPGSFLKDVHVPIPVLSTRGIFWQLLEADLRLGLVDDNVVVRIRKRILFHQIDELIAEFASVHFCQDSAATKPRFCVDGEYGVGAGIRWSRTLC